MKHAPRFAAAAAVLLLTTLLAASLPASAQGVAPSTRINELDVLRHDAGTSDVKYDDVIILDVDDSGAVNVGDLVLSGTYNNAYPGAYVTSEMNALIGHSTKLDAYVVYADVDGNNAYGSADYVFLSSDVDSLPSSSQNDNDFTLRLEDTSEDTFGTLARTPDDDRQDWENDVSDDLGGGAGDASFTWVDTDDDGTFDPSETAYLTVDTTADGDALPSSAIQLSRTSPSGTTTTTTTDDTTTTDGTTTTFTTTFTRTVTQTFTATDTVTVTQSTTITVEATPTGEPQPDEDAAALGAALLLAALVGALLVVRRRL